MFRAALFVLAAGFVAALAPPASADDLDIAFDDLAAQAAFDVAELEKGDGVTSGERRELRALRKVLRLLGKPRSSLGREAKVAAKITKVLVRARLADQDYVGEYTYFVDEILSELDSEVWDGLDRADTAAELIPGETAYEKTERAIERVDAVLERTFDIEALIPYSRIYVRATSMTTRLARKIRRMAAGHRSTLTLFVDGVPVAANEFHATWHTDADGDTRLLGGGSARPAGAAEADACVTFGTEPNIEEEDFFDIDPEFDPNGAFASLELSARLSPDGVARFMSATSGDLDISFLGVEFGIVEGEFEFVCEVGDPDDPDVEIDVTDGTFLIFGVDVVRER